MCVVDLLKGNIRSGCGKIKDHSLVAVAISIYLLTLTRLTSDSREKDAVTVLPLWAMDLYSFHLFNSLLYVCRGRAHWRWAESQVTVMVFPFLFQVTCVGLLKSLTKKWSRMKTKLYLRNWWKFDLLIGFTIAQAQSHKISNLCAHFFLYFSHFAPLSQHPKK